MQTIVNGFPIQNDLKQGDGSSALLLKF